MCLDFSEDLVRRFAGFISRLVPVCLCVHGVFVEPRRVGSVGVLGFSSPVNERVHQLISMINPAGKKKMLQVIF